MSRLGDLLMLFNSLVRKLGLVDGDTPKNSKILELGRHAAGSTIASWLLNEGIITVALGIVCSNEEFDHPKARD